MNGSRPTHPRQGDRSSLDALSRTIEGLEARIEGLMGTAGRGEARPQPEREPRAERPAPQAQRQDPYADRPLQTTRDARPDPLAEIRERQRLLGINRERGQMRAERPPLPETRQDMPAQDSMRAAAPARDHRQPEYRQPDPRPRLPVPPQRDPVPALAMNDIALALVNLRQELKQDISEGVAREVGALRSEIRSIKVSAEDQRFAEDMREDLNRLADSISQLGNQPASHREAEGLRVEFEELRALMDGLAREDSVRHMESRWHGVEDKLHALDTAPLQEELISLAYRLDDIKSHLGTMSADPAVRMLEDKLITIASAIEMLSDRIQPDDGAIAGQFAGLDLRLDEISRAIVAGSRAASSFDPATVQRIEHRMTGLADQIDLISRDMVSRPDPAAAIGSRIEALTLRIEELANAEAAARLEERLEQLSMLMERSQKAPPAPELTGYLADISRKIDALDHGSVNDVLGERLDYLARRIDEMEFQPAVPVAAVDDGAFRRIEDQLHDIAARLNETAAAPPSDQHALKALEDQIAHLSLLISEPRAEGAGLSPAFESRMTAIEDYMATSDEYIIEAARQAAEAVVEAYSRKGMAGVAAPAADLSALTALADDLRHLEDLSRSSEERTQQTFEALHETLVHIAERIETMDGRLQASADVHGYERRSQQPAMPKAAQPVFAQSSYADAPAGFAGGHRDDDHFGAFDDLGPIDGGLAAYPPRDLPSQKDGLSSPVIRTLVQAPDTGAPAETAAVDHAADTGRKAAKPGLIANLGKRFFPGRKTETAITERAVVSPTPPLSPEDIIPADEANELLEPGSGAPDVKKILERVRASQNALRNGAAADADRADYIAAARRAAQAAAQEVDNTQRSATVKSGKGVGATLSQHRRPILMAIGAVLLAMMAIPLVNTLTRGEKAPVAIEATVATPTGATLDAVTHTGDDGNTPASATSSGGAQQPDAGAITTQSTEPGAFTEPAVEDGMPGKDTTAVSHEDSQDPAAAVHAGTTEEVTPLAAEQPQAAADSLSASTAAAPELLTVPETFTPKSLVDAANAGDPAALFEIGARYTEGRGIAADLALAARWYQNAADKGFAPAQYRIANLLEKGTGVERDLVKARAYYQQAADKGNASAMHNLAVLSAAGSDGKPDYAAAVGWFSKAADLGVADSQFNLAILYARGNGVPQDLEESYKWFAIAAKDGDKDAALKRDEVANAMRPEQLESARAKVDLWKPQPLDSDANSVNLPDEWVGKGLKTASIDMKKAVRNIQAILNNNGFDAGKPDGEMGKKTVTAIKAFQTSIGHEPDGKVTDTLVKELLARNK